MPRAPPPPPPDQHALRFTSFAPVGFLNAKNVSSGFVKSDSQSWFSRRLGDKERDEAHTAKKRRLAGVDADASRAEEARTEALPAVLTAHPPNGARQARRRPSPVDASDPVDALDRTIVIHPGSRWLRLGLASHVAPASVPNVIARKRRGANRAHQTNGTARPPRGPEMPANTTTDGQAARAEPTPSTSTTTSRANASAAGDVDMLAGDDAAWDSDDPEADPDGKADADADADPLTAKITSIRGDLRARMRIYKLRGQGNGNSQAATYNSTVRPEAMGEDFEGDFDWTTGEADVWTGLNALRIPDPKSSGYDLRWPFLRGDFNAAAYSSRQEILGDVSKILIDSLRDELDVLEEDLSEYSVILIIPDLYTLPYVRDMSDLLLRQLGFKQLAVVQEAVCSTFGIGVSSACVVDIGARTTKIACVEEGLVIPDTRVVLDFGGDDITSFLFTLLSRIDFPYREADLANWYDWVVIEDLKERIVVLSEGDITLSLNDFFVRRPGLSTQKYSLRVYDDCILAPYALFAPRVIDFEQKRDESKVETTESGVDEIVDIGQTRETLAMRNSVRHLLTPAAAAAAAPAPTTSAVSPNEGTTPAPSDAAPSVPKSEEMPFAPTPLPTGGTLPALPAMATGGSPAPAGTTSAQPGPNAPVAIDVRYESSKLPLDVGVVESIMAIVSGGASSAAAEDRIKKIATNLVIVGGTGGIHNIGFAVESRVAPALAARMPVLNGVLGYVPCPREIEPEHLAWKGIAALGKLDSANELWLCREEWEALGMRALRERAFYWN